MTGVMKETTTPAWEFYDLLEDPHENKNAYDNPKYLEIIEEMKIELYKQRELYGDTDQNYPEIQEMLSQN